MKDFNPYVIKCQWIIAKPTHTTNGYATSVPLEGEPTFATEQEAEKRVQEIIAEAKRLATPLPKKRGNHAGVSPAQRLALRMMFGVTE